MKNKLIFRILGALASALIIVSVFVPFVSVTGYSPSLWETYELTNSLYLPIMIIVFGAIGVIFFSLNVKTEFAYMSVGAIAFFVIIQTIDILDQGAFGSLSIGYYLLVIGALLTGIMAFLTNLKTKKREMVSEEIKKTEEKSMLEQIDKLYNEQTFPQSEMSPIQPIDNVVQPLPIQPLESVVEQMVEEKTIEENPVNAVLQEMPTQNYQVIQEPIIEQVQVENTNQPLNQVSQQFNVPIFEETQVQDVPLVEQQLVVETPVSQPVNPVLQEFSQLTNSAVQESRITPVNMVEQVPIAQEQAVLNQGVATVPLSSISEPVNPIVQEFTNPGLTATPQQSSNELDIFGQPINKS
ncbi:MAG: hypothetical protein IJE04_00410 [Bacilli bacterium]|nr:hypothetical protein [Bacilli bacterium]